MVGGLKVLVNVGRLFFVLFSLLQCSLFCLFLMRSSYHGLHLVIMTILYVPGLLSWIILVVKEGSIHWLWVVLGTHIWLALVPFICVALTGIVDSLDEDDPFLGPGALKLSICITPILVLLMLNTGPPREKHRELLKKLSAIVSLELFDAIEMLEILIDKRPTSVALPDYLSTLIGVLACASLLTGPLDLMEVSEQISGKVHTRKVPFLCRIFVQGILLNTSFLVIRVLLWLIFSHEASIFSVKNFIKIITCCLELCTVLELCGCIDDEKDEPKEQTPANSK